jgi:hypothetical protein
MPCQAAPCPAALRPVPPCRAMPCPAAFNSFCGITEGKEFLSRGTPAPAAGVIGATARWALQNAVLPFRTSPCHAVPNDAGSRAATPDRAEPRPRLVWSCGAWTGRAQPSRALRYHAEPRFNLWTSPCLVVPSRATSCPAQPGRALPSPALPSCAMRCRAAFNSWTSPCLATPCRALPCPAEPCPDLPGHALPSQALPGRVQFLRPCLALPCLAGPRRIQSSRAMPCRTVPRAAKPRHAEPSQAEPGRVLTHNPRTIASPPGSARNIHCCADESGLCR